jgi:Fe-S-cluster containining protein
LRRQLRYNGRVPLTIVRSIVRSFTGRQIREAAAHVRAGGHAIVWEQPSRARIVVPPPKKGDPADLALHAILDLGNQRYRISRKGATKGLATAIVARDCHDIVRDRVERDSVHPGATRTIKLDCLACGACCYSNRVELGSADIKRFERSGRPELARMPYARRSNGTLVLRLAPDRACLQLQPDKKCSIYDIRPASCRTFPAGSECCLSARAEDYGFYDGATPGA